MLEEILKHDGGIKKEADEWKQKQQELKTRISKYFNSKKKKMFSVTVRDNSIAEISEMVSKETKKAEDSTRELFVKENAEMQKQHAAWRDEQLERLRKENPALFEELEKIDPSPSWFPALLADPTLLKLEFFDNK